MKHNWLLSCLLLGVGFAGGWVVKWASPAPVPVVAAGVSVSKSLVSPTQAPHTDSAVPGKRAQREPAVKKPPNMPTEEQMATASKMQTDMSKTMVKRHRTRLEQLIGRLEEKIQLTSEQKSGITAWLDEQMKKMESLDLSAPSAMLDLPELAGSMTNEALEKQLAISLTADQNAALVDFKDNEFRLKADAMALKSLSKLQGVIEFEDGQRDEVYKILTKNAEATVGAKAKNPDISDIYIEGLGIDMDPYDLDLQKMMTDAMTDSGQKEGGENHDSPQMAQKMREAINKRIEDKVDQLRPVLNDRQLTQYREELRSKGMGIYGQVISGLDDGNPKK